MADLKHVFISYARKDGHEYATRLDADLTVAGFRTWREIRDIDPNQDYSAELERAIAQSSHVVCCITPDVHRGDSFVRREIGYALAIKKPVVPLIFENTLPPIHIINVTRIQADIDQWDEMINELTARLRRSDDRTYEQVTLPDDPYRDYLTALYDQIVRYLNLTIFSLITLRGEATPDAVEKTTTNVLPMAFFDMAGIDAGTKNDRTQFNNFQEAFDKYNGRVLLLGEPGAGKTTTLFAFARDAVAARLNDPELLLPILAPIATWDAQKQTPLADWLSVQIPTLKADNLTNLINAGSTLLLLDGLDELGAEREDEKTKANYDPRLRFMGLIPNKNEMIITCRVKDYTDIGAKLSLQGAITLQSLNDAQMCDYLRDLPDLWAALESDNDLREVARTPLLLSLFTFAFHELPDETKHLRDLKGGDARDKIFEVYLKRRYEHEQRKLNANLPYTLEHIYEVLGHLAMDNVALSDSMNKLITDFDVKKLIAEEHVSSFLRIMNQLHILNLDFHTIKLLGREHQLFVGIRFIHLSMRDYFAYYYSTSHLKDNDVLSSWRALDALGKLSDMRATPFLREFLYDIRHRYYAYVALKHIGTPEALAAIEAWRKSQQGGEA